MLNVIVGLCLLCLGIFGIVSNWWAVLDFILVLIPVMLVIFGVLYILSGLSSRRRLIDKT